MLQCSQAPTRVEPRGYWLCKAYGDRLKQVIGRTELWNLGQFEWAVFVICSYTRQRGSELPSHAFPSYGFHFLHFSIPSPLPPFYPSISSPCWEISYLNTLHSSSRLLQVDWLDSPWWCVVLAPLKTSSNLPASPTWYTSETSLVPSRHNLYFFSGFLTFQFLITCSICKTWTVGDKANQAGYLTFDLLTL